MSTIQCFFQVRISNVLRFISIYDLFTDSPSYKVPRRCSLVLLINIARREVKSVGSETGKALGSGHFYEQRKEVELGLYSI
jgi:hypothetical protein